MYSRCRAAHYTGNANWSTRTNGESVTSDKYPKAQEGGRHQPPRKSSNSSANSDLKYSFSGTYSFTQLLIPIKYQSACARRAGEARQ